MSKITINLHLPLQSEGLAFRLDACVEGSASRIEFASPEVRQEVPSPLSLTSETLPYQDDLSWSDMPDGSIILRF